MRSTLSDIDFATLKGLRLNLPLGELGRAFGVSRQAVKKRVKKLATQRYGYVRMLEPRARGLTFRAELTEAGNQILDLYLEGKVTTSEGRVTTSGRLLNSEVTTPRNGKFKIRLHAVQVKYEIKKGLGPKDPVAILPMKDYPVEYNKDLANWIRADISFKDGLAMVSPASLILTGIAPEYAHPFEDLEAFESTVVNALTPAALTIEAHVRRFIPKFQLKRTGPFGRSLIGHVIKKEWAYEHHPVAEDENGEARERIKIFDDENHLRALTDKSKGFGEFETVYGPLSTQDMSKVVDLERAVILDKFKWKDVVGDLDLNKLSVQELKEIAALNVKSITKTVEDQRLQNEFFRRHNDLIKSVTSLLEELKEERRGNA